MLYGMHSNDAFQQLKSEGYKFLYRGILPPLCQKTISVSIMFGMYNQYHHLLDATVPQLNHHLKTCAAAAGAGLTEAILAPFERVQMLLQDSNYHQRFRNTAHAFAELRKYGFSEYYRGWTPILLRNSLSNVLFFTLREEFMERSPKLGNWYGKLLSDFVCGAMVNLLIHFSLTTFANSIFRRLERS